MTFYERIKIAPINFHHLMVNKGSPLKKGMSANQLKRMWRVTYKTAWYLKPSHTSRYRSGRLPSIEQCNRGGRNLGRGQD